MTPHHNAVYRDLLKIKATAVLCGNILEYAATLLQTIRQHMALRQNARSRLHRKRPSMVEQKFCIGNGSADTIDGKD